MLQLKSLMEREALEGSQASADSPSKALQQELTLFPAENSPLTTLPGVARVVHSKASCTVHWLESGKNRPSAKELPAVQILGIQSAPPPRGGSKSGRVGSAAANASTAILADGRRTEPPNAEPSPDSSGKIEEKKPQPFSVSSQQTLALTEEGNGTGSTETGRTCTGIEVNGSAECPSELCKEEQNTGSSSSDLNQTPSAKPPVSSSEESSAPPAKERTVKQIQEEGWSARDAENVTLAELYLMFGKPGKLQLEYEWQAAAVPSTNQENGQASEKPKSNRTNRVLSCLLKLVSTEINPKPLASEVCSTATSPLKTSQEEQNQTLTPPGKSPISGVRSPSFGRQQASVRGARTLAPNSAASGICGRNLPRSLLGSTGESDGSVFAVPTTLPPNSSRHNRMFSPNKEAQLAFRQQLDSISVRASNALLRYPIICCAIDLAAKSAGIIPGSPCRELDSPAVNAGLLATTPSVDAAPDSQLLQQNVPENGLPPPSPGVTGSRDSLLSPPSVASLLDISLPGPPEEALTPGEPQTHISDSIIELAINSTNYGEEPALSPAKLGNADPSKLLASSPSVSPSRGWIPSPSHDPQWYPSDSSDSTLGCLLCKSVVTKLVRQNLF
ncbi:hypothetical protein XENOCAPTIV_009633 [Xenoophorus captivus]|uniref:Uncharacterized protein n=1 Tax=Xenoophorus captivus TaxID=1517983 RepID=A0ABV0S1S4_9TELE